MRRRFLTGLVMTMLGAITGAGAQPASAQSYPSKPVRVVVPFTAGATDAMTRIVAEKLQLAMGQPFLVDNKPGASGMIGADIVAKAPADGYTLLVSVDVVMTHLPHAMSKLPYNVDKDFVPISMLSTTSTALIVNASFPAKTMEELLAYSKANPDKLNFGSGAIYGQVVSEQLKEIGLKTKHIPYKGGGPLQLAIMGGEIETTIMDIGSVVAAGPKIRPLMVLSPARHPKIPSVPTARELGFQRVEGDIWYAMFAPAGTTESITIRLAAELAKILAMPDVKEKFSNIGMEPRATTPAQLATIVKQDSDRWGKIIKAAGIRLE